MNIILIIGIIMLFVGIITFKKEKRSFITGLALIVGLLCISSYILLKLSNISEFFRIATLGVMYLSPIIVVFCGIFFMSNGKVMITKEGKKLANILSLIIGSNILIVILLSFILIVYGSEINFTIYMVLFSILILFCYFGFLFVSYLAYSYIYQKISIKKDIDYIIVLGSGLIGDRVPPLLKSRLDKGIEIYKKQLDKGLNPKIIVSGGQGPDELVSEAAAMKKYLISQDINSEDILVEDKSTTTYENMKFSKNIMDSLSSNYTCVFTTNNYHVFRASLFARKVGLKADGVGSPTAFYFLPSALIREFIAIMFIYKWFNLIFFILYMATVVYSMFPIYTIK